MHLVITISQFPWTQFQKTNNKEFSYPLKSNTNIFSWRLFLLWITKEKSCQMLSLTSKRKSQWQQVKLKWSKCPHQLALGKISSRTTTKKKQKSLLSKKLFLPSIVWLVLCKTKEENILLNYLDGKDREGTSFQTGLEKPKKFRTNTWKQKEVLLLGF